MTPEELAPFFGAVVAEVLTRLPRVNVSFETDVARDSIRVAVAKFAGASGTEARLRRDQFFEHHDDLVGFGKAVAAQVCDKYLIAFGPPHPTNPL